MAIGEREGIRKKPAPDTVFQALKELGAGDIPVIYVYNKADLKETEDGEKRKLPKIQDNRIYMSAKTGEGIPELADMIWKYGGRK